MKKHVLLQTNILIGLIIIIGFTCVSGIHYQTYKKIVEDDIENISKLTSSNIYAEIDNELTKPIFVAQTMANDSFLKTWLRGEPEHDVDSEYYERLRNYLDAYRVKYQYDSVFMISAHTNVYYTFGGLNKVVSRDNEHDDWYYDFLADGAEYKLNIDTDEVNRDEPTVFVDCRIVDADGTLLGVTGVGVRMSRLQEMLKQYEADYDLEALLIDETGAIQIDSESGQQGVVNLFARDNLASFQENILANRVSTEIHWFPEKRLDNCIITRYVENLDWYLVVEKNTEAIRKSFEELIRQDLLVIAVILTLLLTISTGVIRRFNRMLTCLLNTDALTGLPNQKSFSDAFAGAGREDGVLFLFDVDRFKQVNDTRGHLFGNEILALVAAIAKKNIGGLGTVARWGGDEFAGMLFLPADQAEALLEKIIREIAEKCVCGEKSVTVSVGMSEIRENQELAVLLEQSDKALYRSKEQGGNCLTSFQDLKDPMDAAAEESPGKSE